MSYELEFVKSALREWKKLGANVRAQFSKKLIQRLNAPHVPAALIDREKHRYKIKLRASGYRLVYEVRDDRLVVVVIAVGKRNRGEVYSKAQRR